MTALILSSMDFIHLKQYSLLKWFQITEMAIYRFSFFFVSIDRP